MNIKDIKNIIKNKAPKRKRVGLYLDEIVYNAFKSQFKTVSPAIEVLMVSALESPETKADTKPKKIA